MSLFIEVYVGQKNNRVMVASAQADNMSELAATSNYDWNSAELGNKMLGIPASIKEGSVKGHKRLQSVWSLVAKIATLSS